MGKRTNSHRIGFKRLGQDSPVDEKILGVFKREEDLPKLCLNLLCEQRKTWPKLQEGYEWFKQIQERHLCCNGFSVRLQYNPGRLRSSTANVDDKNRSVESCFLCLDQLPPSQKGILYQDNFLILCNPMPIFPSHFTFSHLEHRYQSITEHISTFLHLTIHLGSAWIVLYNGPKCGASAPDHLHFQIVPSGQMPIEKEILEEKRRYLVKKQEGVSLFRIRDLWRELILLEGKESVPLEDAFKRYLAALKRVLDIDEEPMINIAGYRDRTTFRLLIFQRRKHRPDVFYKTGEERVVISPGVIDMGGLLITPVEKDFKRLNEMAVESIYQEVSMEPEKVKRALGMME